MIPKPLRVGISIVALSLAVCMAGESWFWWHEVAHPALGDQFATAGMGIITMVMAGALIFLAIAVWREWEGG